ncbi:unnamed protein product, partial [Choristocarpus tenellus]
LKEALDTKAGQEDITAVLGEMGDVKDMLGVVRESLPEEIAIVQLQQEALANKADKNHTRRQMSNLVSRVAELLRDEGDDPAVVKRKCLSCDRLFHKQSFQEL